MIALSFRFINSIIQSLLTLPPKNVRTVRDLIYWEYAILIAGSAVGDRKNRAFTMSAYMKLKEGKLHPSAILRENKMLVEECANCCAYCGCNL